MAATTDTLEAVVTWLYNHDDWPAGAGVFGLELPDDWRPANGQHPNQSAVIMPDSGTRSLDLPEIRSIFAAWCYGPTSHEAKSVADEICGIVHRSGVTNVTIDDGDVHLGPNEIVSEPIYIREPETMWHRWIVRMLIRVSESPQ